MSRKWERMVSKNRKTVNQRRIKSGQAAISEVSSDPMDTFWGRSWILPLFLIGVSLLLTIAFSSLFATDKMYMITAIGYFLFALFIYFVRRPILRIGKTKLASRRFSGEKVVEADEVEQIEILPGYAVIQLKNRKSRWVFSKLLHRFPIHAISAKLREFADNNEIPLKERDGA